MFGGAYELTIDSKGRLAIPVKFRELLARQYDTLNVVITLEKRSSLLMYPEAEWKNVVNRLRTTPMAGNTLMKSYVDTLIHNADTVEPDATGRVLISPNLRRWVDFDKEVYVVGRDNRLEVWGKANWEAHIAAALDVDPEVMAAELSRVGFEL